MLTQLIRERGHGKVRCGHNLKHIIHTHPCMHTRSALGLLVGIRHLHDERHLLPLRESWLQEGRGR